MNRKNFLRNTVTAAAALTTAGITSSVAKEKESDTLEQVGFNHLPTVTTKNHEYCIT